MSKPGFLYIMTNPSMPNLVKVGMSSRVPTERARDNDLTSTGIPTPFDVEYYAFFNDVREAERRAHAALRPYHHAKEFFCCEVPIAIDAIETMELPFKKLYSKLDQEEAARQIKISIEEKQRAVEQENERKRLAEDRRQADIRERKEQVKKKDAQVMRFVWALYFGGIVGISLFWGVINVGGFFDFFDVIGVGFFYICLLIGIITSLCILWYFNHR